MEDPEFVLSDSSVHAVDIEDIGDVDKDAESDGEANTEVLQPVTDVDDFVLELPPLSDDEGGLIDIGDDFELEDMDEIDFDMNESDLSDLLLSDARLFEQGIVLDVYHFL